MRRAWLAAGLLVAPLEGLADYASIPEPANALNPQPINPSTAGRWMDEEGLGTRIPAARTPSGKPYNIPLDPDGDADDKKKSWTFKGTLEAGGVAVSGDDKAWGWLRYKDIRDGAYLNYFTLSGERPDQARYVEAVGGAVGMQDQFYRVQFGRYNDWKVTASYDGTPQVFTTNYRSLWNGLGTGNMALGSLTPGGTTNAATTQTHIQDALAATDASTLEVVRKKAGVRLDMRISDAWKAYAAVTDERRTGSKPFGAVFGGGGGGGNVEIAEPIDYTTQDFVAGFQFSDPVSSFNLSASASFFRNGIDTFTFENPLYITTNGSTGLSPTSFTSGRFDSAPDNQHFNLKGEYARALPDFFKGQLTATVALGTMRQDEALIAPTAFSLAGGTTTAGGVPLGNQWNTTDALSRPSADARIDTRLADFALSLRPGKDVDVRGKLRYYETRNSTQYLSCNPLTGQWGRILNDGSGLSLVNTYNAAGCDPAAAQALGLVPTAGNVPIASAPFDYRQVVGSVSADWRVARSATINGSLERESIRRDVREREETREDRLKVGYVDRGTIEGSIRVWYEYARRRGDAYDINPYEPYLSVSLGPTPTANNLNVQSWIHTMAQFRSYDIADRDQSTLNGRVDYSFGPSLDGAASMQLRDARFPAELGRTGRQRTGSLTLDLNYQSGSAAVLYGYYAHQQGTLEQKGVQPASCVTGSTYYFYSDGRVLSAAIGAAPPAAPAGATLIATRDVLPSNWFDICSVAGATSPLFPDSRGWDVESRDRSDVLGAGVKYDFGRVKLDANFTRSLGRTRISYAYNAAALGLSQAQSDLAGSGFPDLVFTQNVLQASAFVPINKMWAMRLLVRHETGKVRDWHYDGVAANPMPANNALYLDAGPQDYRTTAVGIFFNVRM
jgi:MtrB/PioB family decaheme-associated outer membrane protein